jgi:hypothetical protein
LSREPCAVRKDGIVKGTPAPDLVAAVHGSPTRMILILDENRLDRTTFRGFPAGIFDIIGNVVFDLRDGCVTLHFEDFRTDFNASLTSDAQFFIHPYSHGFPLDGV